MNFNLKRLKAERVAKGLTQADMANKIGIGRTSYWQKENGLTDIGVEEFIKILEILGYSSSDISIFFAVNVDKEEQNSKKEHDKCKN